MDYREEMEKKRKFRKWDREEPKREHKEPGMNLSVRLNGQCSDN